MSEQPTHAMLVRADDGLHLLPACSARECAERTVTFVTGADVLGIVELYPEPIPGVQFWSAVQLGNAPKTAAELSIQCATVDPSPLDASAPPRVFLQVDDCGDNEDRSEPIPVTSWCDLTWCSESVGGQEIEYVRVDRPWTPPQDDQP